jgi:hypothetical protein
LADPQHGEIGIGVFANQICHLLQTIREASHNQRRAVHDMAVGKQETVRREQESRTGCAIAATRSIADLDMSNRWTYFPAGTNYGLRISIQQSVIGSRRQ